MKINTIELIERSKEIRNLIAPSLGKRVCVQISIGSIYSVSYGIINELPESSEGWDYVVETEKYSCIKFSTQNVVDVHSWTIFIGNL
jgi:hypothetical protein